MDTKERKQLIVQNMQEVIGESELDNLLEKGEEISVYWGTMPTGSISFGYFFPLMKIADFLQAGLKVKILLADLHAMLDSVPKDELKKKTEYYKKAILTILKTANVNVGNLEFVLGSDLQLNKEYLFDLLNLSTFSSVRDSKKAASEVVKLGDNPKLSGLIYPLMQALDEEYLKVDMQFGGMDQRKIMVFARENLPKIGYKSRVEVLNPIIRGLVGEKMSSSQRETKIDLMDNEKEVKKRINKADCVEGDLNNGLLPILKFIIFGLNNKFTIFRPEKFGGNVEYSSYKELEKDFVSKKLHPMDLKVGVADAINNLLQNFREDQSLIKLHKEAYPELY